MVVHAEPHSLTVLVSVEAEDPIAAEYSETLRAFLTSVPSEPTVRVPPVQCTSDEQALFKESATVSRSRPRSTRARDSGGRSVLPTT